MKMFYFGPCVSSQKNDRHLVSLPATNDTPATSIQFILTMPPPTRSLFLPHRHPALDGHSPPPQPKQQNQDLGEKNEEGGEGMETIIHSVHCSIWLNSTEQV